MNFNFINLLKKSKSTQQGFTVLLDQLIGSVVTFICNILVAHANQRSEYGVFFLGLSIVYFTSIIQRSLVSIPLQILTRPLPFNDKANYYASSLLLHFLINIIFSSIIISVGVLFFDQSYILLIIGVIIASAGFNFREFIRSTILADLNTKASLFVNGASNVLVIISYLVMFHGGYLTVLNALILFGIASIIPSFFYIVNQRHKFVLQKELFLNSCVKSFVYGRWILGAVIANTLGIRVIPWLLLIFIDKDAVAIFGALTTVAGVIHPLINGMSNYITPKLANDAHDYGRRNVLSNGLKIFIICLFVTFIYVGLMAFWGDNIIRLFYPVGYTGYTFALAILSLDAGLKGANLLQSGILRAINKPQIEFFSSSIGASVSFLLALLFIPSFSVNGSAVALLIGFVVILCMNWFYLSKMKLSL
jgi:O-antigen/teichoic acid export membrane protein